MKTGILAGAMALATFAAQDARADIAYTCAEANGLILIGSSPPPDAMVRAIAAPGSSDYIVQLEEGDVLSVTQTSGGPATVEAYFPGGSLQSSLPMTIVTQPAGDYPAGTYTITNLYASKYAPEMTSTMPVPQATQAQLTATLNCTPGESGEGGDEALAGASTLYQNGTILHGLRNMRGRTGGGDVQVTQGTVLGYTGDAASGWRVWGFTDFRRYSDAADGSSVGMTVGADHDFGDFRAGMLLSFDKTTLDSGAGDEEVRSVAIGPYITGSAGPIDYDAFVTYSRPEYSLISGDETGERISYGVAGEGAVETEMAMLYPFLTFNGATEDLAGDTLVTQQVSAGLRVTFEPTGNLTPYLSLAYQGTRQESALTGTTEHAAPRYGFGFDARMDNGGRVGFDVDLGETVEDLRDIGLRLSYTLEF